MKISRKFKQWIDQNHSPDDIHDVFKIVIKSEFLEIAADTDGDAGAYNLVGEYNDKFVIESFGSKEDAEEFCKEMEIKI